jgi:hypothetical protein
MTPSAHRRLIVCVFQTNDLNQVTWELRNMRVARRSSSRS